MIKKAKEIIQLILILIILLLIADFLGYGIWNTWR
jgi:hypothetical protein